MLGKLDLHRKEFQISHNLLWKETVCVQTENEFSCCMRIENVVQQGYIFSEILKSIQQDDILRTKRLIRHHLLF